MKEMNEIIKNEIIKIGIKPIFEEGKTGIEVSCGIREDVEELLNKDEKEKVDKNLYEIGKIISDSIDRNAKEEAEKEVEKLLDDIKQVKSMNELLERLIESLGK